MKIDREEHRNFLLSVLNSVPVHGPAGQVEEFIDMLKEVRGALVAAEVDPPTGTAMEESLSS